MFYLPPISTHREVAIFSRMNHRISPNYHTYILILTLVLSVLLTPLFSGCAIDRWTDTDEPSSSLHYWLGDDLDKSVVLAVIANTPLVIIVNLNSNQSTIIKDRMVIDTWSSATGDVSGQYHLRDDEPESQITPPGIYSVHDIEHCPAWLPRRPEGLELTEDKLANDIARQKIFDERQDLYGPCGVNNPLGHFALWFYGAYGYHGTTPQHAYILDLPPAERQVSGGCIRNPPTKIEKLFHIIANELPNAASLREKVKLNSISLEPVTITHDISTQYRVVLIAGNFKRDLPFERSGYSINTVELATLSTCTIQEDEVPIYANSTFSQQEIVGYYNSGDVITPKNKIDPIKRNPVQTKQGWISQYYVSGSCLPSIHYWKKVTTIQPYTSCDVSGIDC